MPQVNIIIQKATQSNEPRFQRKSPEFVHLSKKNQSLDDSDSASPPV